VSTQSSPLAGTITPSLFARENRSGRGTLYRRTIWGDGPRGIATAATSHSRGRDSAGLWAVFFSRMHVGGEFPWPRGREIDVNRSVVQPCRLRECRWRSGSRPAAATVPHLHGRLAPRRPWDGIVGPRERAPSPAPHMAARLLGVGLQQPACSTSMVGARLRLLAGVGQSTSKPSEVSFSWSAWFDLWGSWAHSVLTSENRGVPTAHTHHR
jgi:hypothetical protein